MLKRLLTQWRRFGQESWNSLKERFWGPKPYRVRSVEDDPQPFENRTVYVFGEEGHEWMAAFACPCGCKEVVRLNLLHHGNRPTWNVEWDNRKVATLTPSVWRNVGCRSHFILRNGKIIWC